MFPGEKPQKKMKNYLYSNSIAAHPYSLSGNRFTDHRSEGSLKQQTLDIYNKMNKWKKNLGEIIP